MSKWPALAVFALALLLIPQWIQNGYMLGVLTFAMLAAINVIGLNLLMGFAGQVSMGVAGFYGLGAYTTGVATVHWGVSPWMGISLAVLICGGLSYLIGRPTLRLKGHSLAMATLGIGIVLFIFFMETIPLTGGPDGLSGIPPLSIGDFAFESDLTHYWLGAGALWLVVLLSLNLTGSLYGYGMRALGLSEAGSRSIAIDTHQIKVGIFALSGAFSGLSGALYAHIVTFVSPETFDFHASIVFLTMAVFGGLGSIWGSMAGALLFSFLPEFLVVFQDYDILVYGAVLLATVIFLPKGLGGLARVVTLKITSMKPKS
ncbi:branched-chain amino acid ABC transporter permease [Chrysiogenes arsenatis]|uniref:branched-chain amino acid ABC transporter permease n=1 Tax=Chrysiogenes arsenatis TaxID=309797 RepID=UPI00042A14E1|nr:branched-chain amino acid ABC transporter permease [Chrysiogenes arsenatis]